MPKPVLATAQEVQNLESQLKGEIARVKSESENKTQGASSSLREEIKAVQAAAAANHTANENAIRQARQDAKTYSDDSIENLRKKLTALLPPLEQRLQQADKDLEVKLQAVDDTLRRTLADEIQSLARTFSEQLSADKAELIESMDFNFKQVAEHIKEQKQTIDGERSQDATKAHEDVVSMGNQAAEELRLVVEKQKKVDDKQDEKAQRTQSEIYIKLNEINDSIKELRDWTEAGQTRIAQESSEALGVVKHDTDKQLAHLDEESRRLRDAMSEVENLSTRRVEWVIQKVSKRIRPLSPSRAMLHCSWFSPKFDAAGAHGLQLELQLFRQSDPPVDGQDAGDVAVHLWACKGMNMAYKLYVGSKYCNLEKIFNGRVPYGTKRFAWLRDEINKEDDTLTVGIEILEAIREVQHPVKPPPPPPIIEGESAELRKMKEDQLEKVLEGSVYFYRNINNRLLDQVRHQVEVMQSRMVRKIEWRVEQASMLRRCFPQGESMCSPAFSAAGVDGMQLIFYPSGYNGATDGFCSLFLFGPAGSTLRCTLSAGNQKRDASHTFDEPGAFGRTNFCRYESAIDPDEDTVMITLEIEDAQQDMRATISHPTVQPGDRRTQPQIDGSTPAAIDSVVKLTRAPKAPGQTRKAAGALGLEDKKVLPSLWTAQSMGSLGQENNIPGYQSFDELKNRAQGGLRRRGANNLSMSTAPAAMQSSASMPSFGNSQRTAMQEDLVSPLPSLSRTSGGGDGSLYFPSGAEAGAKKGGRGRRLRSEQSTASMATTMTSG